MRVGAKKPLPRQRRSDGTAEPKGRATCLGQWVEGPRRRKQRRSEFCSPGHERVSENFQCVSERRQLASAAESLIVVFAQWLDDTVGFEDPVTLEGGLKVPSDTQRNGP